MTVRGNATLFEGSRIETAKAPAQVILNNGARLRLATESRALVYQDRLVLEKGGGQLQASDGYSVEARSLHVSTTSPGALARVHVRRHSPVVVAAVRGGAHVMNATGTLVANMEVGEELSFDPQETAAAVTKVSGCLLSKDGRLILVDQTTGVPVVVQGEGLKEELGNRIEITGAANAARVVAVQQIARVGIGGCVGIAKKVGADERAAAGGGPAAPAAFDRRMSSTTKALIGGVAVGGTVGGLAAAGVFSGSERKPSTSR